MDGAFTDFPETYRQALSQLYPADQMTEDELCLEATYDHSLEGITTNRPLVIAHRGASGVYPEHTAKAYQVGWKQAEVISERISVHLLAAWNIHKSFRLVRETEYVAYFGASLHDRGIVSALFPASCWFCFLLLYTPRFSLQEGIDQGADFIECDVVVSKDLKPFCFHDNWLKEHTNVKELFPDCEETLYVPDFGQTFTDCFAHRFTLAQLKTLRVKQTVKTRDSSFDGQLGIVTLAEYLDIIKSANRVVGAYPELKNPVFVKDLDIWKNSEKR